ncbi:MAG: NnrS family protein, partial [Alphaproteobacteria bacterium]
MHSETSTDRRLPVFFSAAFRPFFLFAGLYAMAPLIFWLTVSGGDATVPGPLAPSYWHGHEMLFGFAIAAACGFLLTAVPNWASSAPVTGVELAILVGLWLVGRIAFWFGWPLGPGLVAALDLALLPALAVIVGRRIVAAGLRRNYVFLGLLGILFTGNLLMHLQAIGVTEDTAGTGIRLGIYGLVLLLALIGGRIVPNFTSGALRAAGKSVEASTPPGIEKLVVISLLIAIIADLAGDAIPGGLLTVSRLLAAVALLLRMRNWQTGEILDQPIVWVLHLGHLWLVVGFALLGMSTLTGQPGEG